MQSSQLDKASSLLPSKIEHVFDQPKVFEMIRAIGEGPVKNLIEYELVRVASLMSVGGNLNKAQVKFIAEQFIEIFPSESIADFKICFQRGCIGAYGEIQRMDGITLRGWMDQYLDEKYKYMEDQLMKEKDDLYKPIVLTEKEKSNIDVDGMLNTYLESLKDFEVKKVRPLSEEEIKEEGAEDADPYLVWKNRYLKNRIK